MNKDLGRLVLKGVAALLVLDFATARRSVVLVKLHRTFGLKKVVSM